MVRAVGNATEAGIPGSKLIVEVGITAPAHKGGKEEVNRRSLTTVGDDTDAAAAGVLCTNH